MKINAETKLFIMSANEKPSMDGKDKYYNLAVMQNGEVANISCTENVYNEMRVLLTPGTVEEFRFNLQIDTVYEKSRKLTALLPYSDNSPKINGGNTDNSNVSTDKPTDSKADTAKK